MEKLSYITSEDAVSIGIAWGAKNRDIYAPVNDYRHTGIDLVHSSKDTPIYSLAAGTVVWAGYEIAHGYGRHVLIEHVVNGIQFFTRYAHLADIRIYEGQGVVAGQRLGTMGGETTDPYRGVSGGKHLHFELLVPDKPVGRDFIHIQWADLYSVDPFTWLAENIIGGASLRVVSRNGLNVRNSPSVAGKKLYALPYNTQHRYTYQEKDAQGNTWCKLSTLRDEWTCSEYKGSTLADVDSLDVVDVIPDATPQEVPLTLESLARRVEMLEKIAGIR